MSDEELAKLLRKELKRCKGLSKKVLDEAGMDSTVGSKPGSQSLSEAAPKKTASVGPKATRSMKTRSAQSKVKASPRDLQTASKPMAKKMTVPSQANKGELSLDTPKKTLQQHKADATEKIGPANLKVPQPKEKKQIASPREGRTSAKKSKAEVKTSAVSIPKQQRPVAIGKAPKYVASKLPPSKTIYVESSDSEADVLVEEKLQKKKKVRPKALIFKKVMDTKQSMLKPSDPKGSELIPAVAPSATETGT
ncbi:MAG: hypothetical protein GY836_13065, partial [Herbaspirillum sp.]|uniref:hypothetical protein n=1 Tax=Herbaspirillum sp. TaxID=1890675 RepID=UPI0025889A8E